MKRNNIIILSVILALGLLTMLAMPQHKAVKPANKAAIDPAAMQRVLGRVTGKAGAWLEARRLDSLRNIPDSIGGTLTFSDGSAAVGVVFGF